MDNKTTCIRDNDPLNSNLDYSNPISAPVPPGGQEEGMVQTSE